MKLTQNISIPIWGIFLLLSFGSLIYAKELVMPMVYAFFLTIMFYPVVRFLDKLHIHRVISSLLIIFSIVATAILSFYNLSEPTSELFKKMPKNIAAIEKKLRVLEKPIVMVNKVSDDIEKMTNITGKSHKKNKAVQIKSFDIKKEFWSNSQDLLSFLLLTLLFQCCFLIFGPSFIENLKNQIWIKNSSRLTNAISQGPDKIIYYLYSVTLINLALGLCTGLGLYFIGVEYAITWGVLAAIFNFVPYIGPISLMILLSVFSIIQQEQIILMIIPGLYFVILNIIEAYLITPFIIGKKFDLNPLIIIFWVVVISWFFGIAGALVSMPLLILYRSTKQAPVV